eukprot:g5307.t1
MSTTIDRASSQELLSFHDLLSGRLGRLLRFALSDPADRIREASISLLKLIFQKLNLLSKTITNHEISVLKKWHSFIESILEEVCLHRFGKNTPIGECCEELRLELVFLVKEALPLLKNESSEILELVFTHINRALRDSHSDVKKAVSLTLQTLVSSTLFHWRLYNGNREDDCEELKRFCELERCIAVALIANASHQHSKVRTHSFLALHDLVLYRSCTANSECKKPCLPYVYCSVGQAGGLLGLEEELGRLFLKTAQDRVSHVRKVAYRVLISWLTGMRKTRIELKTIVDIDVAPMLPLSKLMVTCLLTGCADEVDEIQTQCIETLEALNSRLSDKDAAQESGTRRLAKWLETFLLRKVESLLSSWNIEDRLNAVHILFVFLVATEGDLTATTAEEVVQFLVIAASNEDSRIAKVVICSAQQIGSTVSLDVCVKSLTQVFNSRVSANTTEKALMLLVAKEVLHGERSCPNDQTQFTIQQSTNQQDSLIAGFIECLMSPKISECEEIQVKTQLRETLINFMKSTRMRCKAFKYQLFMLLLNPTNPYPEWKLDTSVSCQMESTVFDKGHELQKTGMVTLARLLGMESIHELATSMANEALLDLTHSFEMWTSSTHDFHKFCELLTLGGIQILHKFYSKISEVFIFFLSKHQGVQHIRLLLLLLMESLFETANEFQIEDTLLEKIVTEWILPATIWRAGKTAACVRFAAVSVLGAIFEHHLLTKASLWRLIEQGSFLPALYQSLEEEHFNETRLMGCYILNQLSKTIGIEIGHEIAEKLLEALFMRLDDHDNQIRIASLHSLSTLIQYAHNSLSLFQLNQIKTSNSL